MTRAAWLVMLVLAACKGDPKPASSTAAGSAAPGSAAGSSAGSVAGSAVARDATTPTATPTATTPDAAARPAADESCASPCRFLAETPLAEIADKVRATCGTEWPAVSASDCAQLDYQRNCIFATAGYTFKKPIYQSAFGLQPWYTPRAGFKDSDLSKVATANVAELKRMAASCRQGNPIDARDRALVDAWLADIQAGKVQLEGDGDMSPKKLYAKRKLERARYVTPDAYSPKMQAAATAKGVRVLFLDFSEPEPDNCDECEGFGIWLELAIDANDQVIAVEQGFAACPFAYLVTAAGPVLQGELLRNLDAPTREGTQALAVTAPCGGPVTYRITEEKEEVTQLDELTLVVDGLVLRPTSCTQGGALCANDGVAHSLAKGDAVEVSFEVPHGLACTRTHLRANGHYVPR